MLGEQKGGDLNFVMKARREKLAALEAAGVTPFAYGFDPTHDTSSALRLLPPGVEQSRTGRRFSVISPTSGRGSSSTSGATISAKMSFVSLTCSTSATSSAFPARCSARAPVSAPCASSR
jgi:hypothetical protein